jgi:ribosome-associated protein
MVTLFKKMLTLSDNIIIPDDEIDISAIRAQGAGGQNVNKVSSAIHLRFDISASSLPDLYKEKLLKLRDQRITKEGVIIIKAQQYRTREKNREDALNRLKTLIEDAMVTQKPRKPTRPSKASKRRRLDSKTKQGRLKESRGKVDYE